jgi:hypothetical protein
MKPTAACYGLQGTEANRFASSLFISGGWLPSLTLSANRSPGFNVLWFLRWAGCGTFPGWCGTGGGVYCWVGEGPGDEWRAATYQECGVGTGDQHSMISDRGAMADALAALLADFFLGGKSH